jgi:hypothetical protein
MPCSFPQIPEIRVISELYSLINQGNSSELFFSAPGKTGNWLILLEGMLVLLLLLKFLAGVAKGRDIALSGLIIPHVCLFQ